MSKRHYDEDRQDSGKKPRTEDSRLPELYSIFHAEIARIQPYGAFVKLPGYQRQGLVHRSQMSRAFIEDPSEMVSVKEQVYVKIISIEESGEKIGLSMKVVNQTTGQDLDPNNVELSQDERKKRKGHRSENNKIELGAVLDTTCKKCGGRGHLAQDCFHKKDGKTYELLPDLDEMVSASQKGEESKAPSPKKKKKEKKEKHKKKKKHRHHSGDMSENDKDIKKHKKEKHKKHKSHKKDRRPSHASTDPGSDS